LSGEGSAVYDLAAESSLKTTLRLTNCIVQDVEQKFPSTPLGAEFRVDGSLRQQTLDLRQVAMKWSPTARAKNELQVQAHVELGATNAKPSQFTVRAESLDLTPYYDIFGARKNTNAPGPAPTSAVAAQTSQ